jgi:flagellar hook-basal body complex protein FliE
MDIRTSLAAQSYAEARAAAAPADAPADGAEGAFARLAGSFAETLNRAETTARAAMAGGADPHALVEALAASSLAVETAVTVRDRVVEAYQEILRMPV